MAAGGFAAVLALWALVLAGASWADASAGDAPPTPAIAASTVASAQASSWTAAAEALTRAAQALSETTAVSQALARAAPLAPLGGPNGGAPQAVNGAQMGQLKSYGTRMGENLLKSGLGVDVDSLALEWDQAKGSLLKAGAAGGASAAGATGTADAAGDSATGSRVRVHLVQTGSLAALAGSAHALPYGVEVHGTFKPSARLAAIDTHLNIPLSPYDAWRADASMPLDFGAVGGTPWWWRGLGLGRNVALTSDVSSRLGFNEVEAGFGTDWMPGIWGRWNLNYSWQVRYGEGVDESSNWLKVSKRF